MRAAVMKHIGVVDAVARHAHTISKRRFSSLLNYTAVARLLTIWLDQQAGGVDDAAGFNAVFETPRHAPPYRYICT